MTRDDAALLVAMELLRQSLDGNTMGSAANTKRTEAALERQARELRDFVDGKAYRPERATSVPGGIADTEDEGGGGGGKGKGKGAAGAVSKVLDLLASKFTAVLAPLALFGAAVAAPASGLQTFLKSVQALAASLAPIFTPVSVLFSTAVLAVSEVLTGELAPVLEDWYAFILEEGIPAIEQFIEWVLKAAEAAKGAYDLIPDTDDVIDGAIVGGATAVAGPIGGGIAASLLFDRDPADAAAAPGDPVAGPAPRSSARGITSAALSDTLASLRLSLGPRAAISGLSGAASAAQLAALNVDPIEQRILKANLDMLNRLERIARNTTPGGKRVYGDGDFGSGTGAGGGSYGEVF